MKINRISPESSPYLQIVATIANAPEKLYFLGKLPDQRRPSVAIVGTRKPTAYGKEVTHKLTYDLASYGVIIISGLALGVDAIAHRSALEAGGTTLAILGNGLPALQPSTNRSLGESIISSGGAVLTEYEPDTPALLHHFLARNRIVSGLSDAIIITEAAARSGTLNTAMHALEQGREVFVVPGNITSSMSAGCNLLLRQGATPVTSAEDVLEIIAPDLLRKQAMLPLGSNQLETDIIRLVAEGVRDGDEIQKRTGTDAADFSVALTMLELSGAIRSLGANRWTLR